jgi:hypothetical protein
MKCSLYGSLPPLPRHAIAENDLLLVNVDCQNAFWRGFQVVNGCRIFEALLFFLQRQFPHLSQGYPNGELEKLKEKADLVRVEENWKNQKILKNQKKLITWNARFAISKPWLALISGDR